MRLSDLKYGGVYAHGSTLAQVGCTNDIRLWIFRFPDGQYVITVYDYFNMIAVERYPIHGRIDPLTAQAVLLSLLDKYPPQDHETNEPTHQS